MRLRVELDCDVHDDPRECPDCVVIYSPKFREYLLPIRDGLPGPAIVFLQIRYCPWCGTKLPESLRYQWFDALENMGLEPEDEAVPPEFEDERWWRNLDA